MFAWYHDISCIGRLTSLTCLGRRTLDAPDAQMFSLAIPALVATWHLDNDENGLTGSTTLVTSALGGWLGGALSNRIGQVRALLGAGSLGPALATLQEEC